MASWPAVRAFRPRVVLNGPLGPTARFWEPVQDPLQGSDPGAGTWSPVYVLSSLSWDGGKQAVALVEFDGYYPQDVAAYKALVEDRRG